MSKKGPWSASYDNLYTRSHLAAQSWTCLQSLSVSCMKLLKLSSRCMNFRLIQTRNVLRRGSAFESCFQSANTPCSHFSNRRCEAMRCLDVRMACMQFLSAAVLSAAI